MYACEILEKQIAAAPTDTLVAVVFGEGVKQPRKEAVRIMKFLLTRDGELSMALRARMRNNGFSA